MTTLLLLIRLVLAAVFAVAAIAKFRDRAGTRKAAKDFGVPSRLAGLVALVLPVVELACALALLVVPTSQWAAAGLLGLLLVFSVAMVISLVRGREIDCRCFGQLQTTPVGPASIFRNGALAAMAATIVFVGAGPSLPMTLAALDGGQMLNLVLGLVIVGGVFVIVQILTQYGKLLLRVESLEARVGGGAAVAPVTVGLPVGTPAPDFALDSLDGKRVTLETLSAARKPVVLLFVAPSCPACDEILPAMAEWQREHKDRLTVALISRNASETRAKVKGLGLDTVLLQNEREVAESYQVPATPGAVLIRNGSIATQVATGPDGIRSLVEDATLPSPVKRGDLLPSMKVRTADGGSLNLAALLERSLVVFWNPGCGFCQQMLDDLKRWERDGANAGTSLVIVSAGSEAEIRAQEFSSVVIRDEGFRIGRIFGATGTPSAVLLEQGRVASAVAVGAPAVMELVGVKQPVPA